VFVLEYVGAARSQQTSASVVIGDYIVDFLAPAVSLVVEVDGGYHWRRCGADARRDRMLGRAGYRVLRLEGELVVADLSRAVSIIVDNLG
jgi:very-short-patch-repair endonuclease